MAAAGPGLGLLKVLRETDPDYVLLGGTLAERRQTGPLLRQAPSASSETCIW